MPASAMLLGAPSGVNIDVVKFGRQADQIC